MATLRIVEYKNLAVDGRGNIVPIPEEPSLGSQVVTFTTSTQSAAFRADTKYVRLESSADAYVKFGTNPTATAASGRIPANTVEWRGVAQVASLKVAVYDGSS